MSNEQWKIQVTRRLPIAHWSLLIAHCLLFIAPGLADPPPAKAVAALVTVYNHNSHAELIAGRLLQTDTLDGKGARSALRLASLYTDQHPSNDLSRRLAAA